MALWILEADDDGRSLYSRRAFFPMPGEKEGCDKRAHSPKAEIDVDRTEAYHDTVSRPFEIGAYARITLRIVDDVGLRA